MSITSKAGQRILSLLDENSFIEIGGLITARSTDFNLAQNQTPSDGVITGCGIINGNPVYVYSQDMTVLNGTIGEMHAKKILKIYDLAMKTGAPVIGLIDSAGLRLQEATDALEAFGEIYFKQSMASGVIPQITGVFGKCGGGLAILSALSDFTFMEEKAKFFVNAPNALVGNFVEKCDTSSAEYQSENTSNIDVVGSEEVIIEKMRELIGFLPSSNEDNMSFEECTDDLNRLCNELESQEGDAILVASQIADNHVFFEVKKNFAKELVIGFMQLNGATVGVVANCATRHDEEGNKSISLETVLSVRGCEKATKFVKFCNAFSVPILTLTNITGFQASKCCENKIAGASAKFVYELANATVPKVNVVIGKAFGSAGIAMNSKAIGADFSMAWPKAEIGTMDATLAAKIMYEGQGSTIINEKAKEYAQLQTSATGAAKRGYIDQIIEPCDTRKYVIGAFEILYTKQEERPTKKHGTV